MIQRKLGRTNIIVSKLSFGTVSLGLPYGIGITNRNTMLNENQSCQLLNKAMDAGVNFFDTAIAYGASQEILGKALRNRRAKAVICTKPAHLYDCYKGQKLPSNSQIKRILNESFEQSLLQLQTDYIDIYMSHDGTLEIIENDTVIDFYQNKKKEGVIRATGISVYTLEQSLKAINSGVWDVIQLQFNLMDQRQSYAIELAKTKDVGIVVRSVLLKGVLTGRGCSLHPVLQNVEQHRQKYMHMVKNGVESLAELAIKFVLSFHGISSVLIGIDKIEYLENALRVFSGNDLDEQIILEAKALAYPDPEFLDLPMWDRNGWL